MVLISLNRHALIEANETLSCTSFIELPQRERERKRKRERESARIFIYFFSFVKLSLLELEAKQLSGDTNRMMNNVKIKEKKPC